MSPKVSRRILWIALLATAPLPMWFIGGGRLPPLALFQISTYMAAVFAVEGGPGTWLAVWVIGGQGLLGAAALYLVARLTAAAAARIGEGRVLAPLTGALVIGLFAMSLFEVYHAAIVARGEPVNIFGAY